MPPIHTALLSFGMSGRLFHAPFIDRHPGFVLRGSWERSKKTIGDRYPQALSYDSLEALLDDPEVDLVIVNTPTATHYEYARKALQHGKHVVVEKAFAGNAGEAIELRDLAQRRRCKLSVFQNRRWDSDFMAVRRVVDDGVLGRIVEANLGFLRFDPNLSPKSHKEVPSSGSGIVKDLGPHVIDQALVLFGMPDAVFADVGVTRERSRVDDYFDILMIYDDKRVHVKGGCFFRQPLPEYSVFGTEGCFIKTRSDVQERQLDRGVGPGDEHYGLESGNDAGFLYTGVSGDAEVERISSPRGNYMAFYEGVCASIVDDRPEPVTATEGIRVMRIIDAAMQSHEQRCAVVPRGA